MKVVFHQFSTPVMVGQLSHKIQIAVLEESTVI